MEDDTKVKVVFHPAGFIYFFFFKTKLLGTRSVSIHLNSEIIFTDNDFTFKFFFLTISGKKKIGIKININIVERNFYYVIYFIKLIYCTNKK